MSSSLKIIATPIGNIRDITLRALDELKAADIILAEDTRHSKSLLSALNIKLKDKTRLISCDAHKEEQRIELVMSSLEQNLRVVLVSDAGTPTISDPGSLLVQGLIEKGAGIEVLPGPSALTAALMGAGINMTRFAFLGFLPKSTKKRHKIILSAAQAELALVIYESPLRLKALLEELFRILGPRRVVVARELTKIYESFHRGTLGSTLSPEFLEKGECVVLIEAENLPQQGAQEPKQEIIDFIRHSDQSTKSLVELITIIYKLKKKEAYNLILKIRK